MSTGHRERSRRLLGYTETNMEHVMEIKKLPVAKTAGAILLTALSTSALADYNCRQATRAAWFVTGHLIIELPREEVPLHRITMRCGSSRKLRLLNQELKLRQQELEFRQLELEQRRQRRQGPEEYIRQTNNQPTRPPIFGNLAPQSAPTVMQ